MSLKMQIMATQVDMFPGSVSKSMVFPWNWATFTLLRLLLVCGLKQSPPPPGTEVKTCWENVIGLVLIRN